MGIETALIGSAVASGVGGAVKGAKGTPEQVTTQEQQTKIQGAGGIEQGLQRSSLENYNQAQQQAQGLEGQIGAAQSFQEQARQAAQGILGGQAFNVTPEEQMRIQGLRDALVQQGTADVGFQTQQGLQKALGSAAGRGLRGQALGALQGQVLESQQRNVRDIANQANTMAAQQYMQAPQQRIAAQQGIIGQGLSLADLLRQQAFQNRNTLQDPTLMNTLQRERLAGASQVTRGVVPGQKGSFADALAGGLAGASGGVSNVANIAGTFRNFNNPTGQGYQNSGGGFTSDQNLMDMRKFYMNS